MSSNELHSSKQQRLIVVISTVAGATVEWYDFFVFGILSALFLNKLFFPTFDPLTGTILAFMTFGTAWLARPIGGVIGGHLGDRIGRKTTLLWGIMLMGISTVLIGLLPTYETWGPTATVLLVFFRLLQGLAVGAEFGSAVVTMVEHAEESKRGFFGSLPQLGMCIGLLLSNAVFFALASLDQQMFLSWAWRIPFLASIVTIPLGFYILNRMVESPEFAKAQRQGAVVQQPLVEAIRYYARQFFSVLFALAAVYTFFWTFVVYMISYSINNLGFTQAQVLGAISIGAIVECFTIPLSGVLADRIGRRTVFCAGFVFLCVAIYPFFMIAGMRSFAWLAFAYAVVLGIGHSAIYSSHAPLFAEMFPPSVRTSGVGTSYQLAGLIFGAPLPVLATLLVATWGIGSLAIYMILVGLMSLVAIMLGVPHYSLLKIRHKHEGAPDKVEPVTQ